MRISDSSGAYGSSGSYSGQNTVKSTFMHLVEKGKEHPEKHLNELSDFFNNLYHKKCLKSQIHPQKAGAFGALWDGALVIVNTIDLDSEQAVKDADFSLLKDDLVKLANLF